MSLASGRRVSEVHALENKVSTERDGSLSLSFIPGFLAKNQPLGCQSPPIVIKPLVNILCSDDEDRKLCQVRALRVYGKRTKALRSPRQRLLFIPYREYVVRDLSRASVSRWVRNVIKAA